MGAAAKSSGNARRDLIVAETRHSFGGQTFRYLCRPEVWVHWDLRGHIVIHIWLEAQSLILTAPIAVG
jgi:hypothetical protein